MPLQNIAILGAGPCGLFSALAITHYLSTSSPPPAITIFEVRPIPSTIGGAVNLTPNALRSLDLLGVLSILRERRFGYDVETIELFSVEGGGRMGTVEFTGPEGEGFDGYKALRISRAELLDGLLEAVRRLGNVKVEFGRKTVGLEEGEEGVKIVFEDGGPVTADLVLGCDGIHSATRMMLVDPERRPVYSGVATAYGFAEMANVKEEISFRDTSANASRRGTLLASYCDPQKRRMYVAAVTETEEVSSREGWKAKRTKQEEIRLDILDRFGQSKIPCLGELIRATESWFLYSVYKLPPGGKWRGKRTMLLGDAAHAMPPQGESVGIALEDAILFARILAYHGTKSFNEIFDKYESLRRERIDDAYKSASFRWETVKDKGWLAARFVELLTPWFLWWTKRTRDENFGFDIGKLDLGW